jgi:hypothetical protein
MRAHREEKRKEAEERQRLSQLQKKSSTPRDRKSGRRRKQ